MTSSKAPTAKLKRSVYVSPLVLDVLDQEAERLGVSFNYLVNYSVLRCRKALAGIPGPSDLVEDLRAMTAGAP